MQKITPFLWFDGQTEEAMEFYTAIFKNSKIIGVMRYGEAGPGPKGTVMSATFELEGQQFIALNGGPQFTFSPAGRGRQVVGEARRGWRTTKMRLAQGQVRRLLADHSRCFGRDVAGRRYREIQKGHGGDARNG